MAIHFCFILCLLGTLHLTEMKQTPGADPGFQVRGGGGGALKKIAPRGGRR